MCYVYILPLALLNISRKECDKYFEETSSKGKISDRGLFGRPRLWGSRRRTGIACEEPEEGIVKG